MKFKKHKDRKGRRGAEKEKGRGRERKKGGRERWESHNL